MGLASTTKRQAIKNPAAVSSQSESTDWGRVTSNVKPSVDSLQVISCQFGTKSASLTRYIHKQLRCCLCFNLVLLMVVGDRDQMADVTQALE